jgi:hypothetical protein
MRALAMHVCVLRPGLVRCRDALAIWLSGEAIQSLTFTGPVLSQPTKAWLLESHGLTLKEGFAATITEYLIYAFVTVGMSVGGLLFLLVRFEPPAAVAGAAVVLVCLCGTFLMSSAVAIVRRSPRACHIEYVSHCCLCVSLGRRHVCCCSSVDVVPSCNS